MIMATENILDNLILSLGAFITSLKNNVRFALLRDVIIPATKKFRRLLLVPDPDLNPDPIS